MTAAIIEGTILLIILFLVLTHSGEFSTIASSIGSQYTGAVSTLQGR